MLKFSVREEVKKKDLEKYFGDFDIHSLTKQLLVQRGIKNRKSAEKFLNPSYENDIGDPFGILGMDKAVKRILDAMKKGEKICIYSDYDCDGIPGGVLLRTFFDDIGYPVEMYIPHRHNEGYGVHNHAIDALKKKGVSLIITVDLAITNIDEVAYAKKKGIDFIVTDHHLPITKAETRDKGLGTKKLKTKNLKLVQVVPDAVAVINSKQDACKYHDDMLCGCAVAWKLSCAILATLREAKIAQDNFQGERKKVKGGSKTWNAVLSTVAELKAGYEKWLLDLVGISTISDMVPLVKENRALAHFGLKVLRQTKRAGLNHIFRNQGISREHLTEDDIAFTIAPRINAASRMGEPMQAHKMLYERDGIQAQKWVEDLEMLNTERKLGVKDILGTIDFDHSVYQNDIVVVGNLSWGPGILGLIAQNIIDETGKPTFVYGQGDDKNVVKGSCRSRGDVHVVELMTRVQEMFPGVIVSSGGHEQAGGFECTIDGVEKLSKALNDAVKLINEEKKDLPAQAGLGKEETVVDAYLSFEDVNHVTHNAIQALAPFGVGNPKPLFAFKNAQLISVRWFGKKFEHLEVVYPNTKAIMFFAPKELEEKLYSSTGSEPIRTFRKHTLLAHIEKSVFRGKTELRLRIKEIV